MSCFDPPGPGFHGMYDVPHAYSLPRIPPAVTRKAYNDICIYIDKNITVNGNGAKLVGYDTPSKNNRLPAWPPPHAKMPKREGPNHGHNYEYEGYGGVAQNPFHLI